MGVSDYLCFSSFKILCILLVPSVGADGYLFMPMDAHRVP